NTSAYAWGAVGAARSVEPVRTEQRGSIMTDLGETMFVSPELAAIFSGRTMVQRMLDVEAALLRAQARAGMIPQASASAIGAKCRVELLNLDSLFRDAAEAGTPAIPLV